MPKAVSSPSLTTMSTSQLIEASVAKTCKTGSKDFASTSDPVGYGIFIVVSTVLKMVVHIITLLFTTGLAVFILMTGLVLPIAIALVVYLSFKLGQKVSSALNL